MEVKTFEDVDPSCLMTEFVDVVETLPDELVANYFEGIVQLGSMIMDILVKSQHEFWSFLSICMPCMQKLSLESQGFSALMEIFTQIVEKLVQSDPDLAEVYFNSFVLEKIGRFIVTIPAKTEVMCHLLYSFSPPTAEARMKIIQKLAEQINNIPVLVKCLSFLIRFDKEYNDELHDIFIYYALVGLDNSSPTVRTCSLSIFSSIAALNPLPIMRMVGHLKNLSEDPWWEVRA
jgi:hypothetical protein